MVYYFSGLLLIFLFHFWLCQSGAPEGHRAHSKAGEGQRRESRTQWAPHSRFPRVPLWPVYAWPGRPVWVHHLCVSGLLSSLPLCVLWGKRERARAVSSEIRAGATASMTGAGADTTVEGVTVQPTKTQRLWLRWG